jgi:hypothetical protein
MKFLQQGLQYRVVFLSHLKNTPLLAKVCNILLLNYLLISFIIKKFLIPCMPVLPTFEFCRRRGALRPLASSLSYGVPKLFALLKISLASRRSASRHRAADGLAASCRMAFPCSSSLHSEHCVGIGTIGVACLSVGLSTSCPIASQWWFQLYPVFVRVAAQGVRLPSSCCMASRSSLLYSESCVSIEALGVMFAAPCRIAFPCSFGLDAVHLSRLVSELQSHLHRDSNPGEKFRIWPLLL